MQTELATSILRSACVLVVMVALGACESEERQSAEAPPPPALTYPPSGTRTGSVRVPADAPVSAHPLRPRLHWSAVDGARDYQLQIDDSCELESYRDCEFPTAEVDARVPGEPAPSGDSVVHRPPANLAVASDAPAGRRYFWRVRACAEQRCGAWSEVRHLDVGRLDGDLDGDGYADVAIGAPMHDVGEARDAGSVFVFYGSADGAPERCDEGRCARIDDPSPQPHARFGAAVASADLNGDGFSDLVIGAPGRDTNVSGEPSTPQEGNVLVYYGGPAGVDVECDPTRGASGRCALLDNPDDQTDGRFGSSLASGGDVDGDGYADLIVGAPSQMYAAGDEVAYDSGAAFVYYGGPEGVARECVDADRCTRLEHPDREVGAELGAAVGGGGDLNGDGFADVLVGSGSGLVLVLYGSARGVDPTCSPAECTRLERTGGRFGASAAIVGDVEGDGYDELLVGAPRDPGARSGVFEGAAFVYRGGPEGIAAGCDFAGSSCGVRLVDPDASEAPADPMNGGYVFLGVSVAGGDVDADGHADVWVGTYRRALIGQDGPFATSALLFHGAPGGLGECPSQGCRWARLSQLVDEQPINVSSLSTTDVDGDGYADVVLGTPLSLRDGVFEAGEAVVLRGGPDGVVETCAGRENAPARCQRLPNPTPEERGFFGASGG